MLYFHGNKLLKTTKLALTLYRGPDHIFFFTKRFRLRLEAPFLLILVVTCLDSTADLQNVKVKCLQNLDGVSATVCRHHSLVRLTEEGVLPTRNSDCHYSRRGFERCFLCLKMFP